MSERTAADAARRELWRQWKTERRPEARLALIEHYVPLVEYVSDRLSAGLPRTVSRDDLIGFGTVGLIDAIEKFDFERGLRFETYASWRIRGAILDGLRQNDWVPRSVREKARRIEEAYHELEQSRMRSVSEAEVAEYLQVDEAEFRQMLKELAAATVCSFDEPIKEEEDETRLSLLIDESAKNPESTVHDVFLKEVLAEAIEKLTEKERTVISLFYFEELTLSEIAEVMSLSPSRISQLHSKAIGRLRQTLADLKSQLLEGV